MYINMEKAQRAKRNDFGTTALLVDRAERKVPQPAICNGLPKSFPNYVPLQASKEKDIQIQEENQVLRRSRGYQQGPQNPSS